MEFNMKKSMCFLSVIVLLTLGGCKELMEVQYFGQNIEIAYYDTEELSNLLFTSHNNEVINNTIILLMQDSQTFFENYDSVSGDKDAVESKKIVNKIFELCFSKDFRVATSSLRFVRIGMEKLDMTKDRSMLIEKMLKVKSKNTNVRFEQINALTTLIDKDTVIEDKLLHDFFYDRSWLISRTTYKLINALENDKYRNEIIKRYEKTKEEFERLLLLEGLKKNFDEKIFDFFKKELAGNKNDKIRKFILSSLGMANDKKAIMGWIKSSIEKFSKTDIINLAESCYNDTDVYLDFNFELINFLLDNGFNPNDSLNNEVSKLFESLMENKDDKKEKFDKMDKFLSGRPDLKNKWNEYKKNKSD